MSENVENPSIASDAGSKPLAKEKWERYCQSRAIHNSRLVAYLEAGFRAATPKIAGGNGAKLELLHPEIRDRIAWLSGQNEEITRRIALEIRAGYCAIMRADIADYYHEVERPILDKEGKPILDEATGAPKTRVVEEIKPFSEMAPEQRFAIAGLKYTDSGRPNLELYPRTHAQGELRKMLGIGAIARDEGDEFSRMTRDELAGFIARELRAIGSLMTAEAAAA